MPDSAPMRTPVVALLLLAATSCGTGPYSIEAQLNRRLGNIRDHLAPETLGRTVSRRVSNMGRTTGAMVQVPSRLQDLEEDVRGLVVGEWDRTRNIPSTVEKFVDVGTNRLGKTVRKIGDPPYIWRRMWSPSRILARLEKIVTSLGTTLRLDRRIMPMANDPERRTNPDLPPEPSPSLWERILYRLRF